MRTIKLRTLSTALLLFAGAAFAQAPIGEFTPDIGIDLSGNWGPVIHEDFLERIPGPELVNFAGLPINAESRMWGLSWDSSRLTVPEHQCQVHVAPYIYRGPLQLRIWTEKDPQSQKIVAIKNYISTYEQTRTIWMDGRPHPPAYAPHTWMGFSTGKWDGNILTVYTTHIKQGWIRRDGLPESDQATLVEHFIRHGDHLTHVSIATDPIYLSEPLVKSQDFLINPQNGGNWLYPCEVVDEVPDRPKGKVPNYLPEANPFLTEYANMYHLTLASALGGPETMYPEWQQKIKQQEAAPKTNETPAQRAELPMGPVLQSKAADPIPHDGDVHLIKVQGNVYMLVGAGGNITVQVGNSGTLIVDTGNGSMSDKVIAALHKLLPDPERPLQYIVDTSFHEEQTGGNEALRKAGTTITGANVTGDIADARLGAAIIAEEHVLDRLSAPTGKKSLLPSSAWPTDTAYIYGEKKLYFNGEPVTMYHVPNASTDGDSIVHFRQSDVISTGDIFTTVSYPHIDIENGGSVQGEIDALNRLIDMTVPIYGEEGGTFIVPGHGRVCDEWELVEYRDMVTIIRDRVQAAIKKGMTLDQVKNAHLTADYDLRYNNPQYSWGTADRFIESIYKTLTAQGKNLTAQK